MAGSDRLRDHEWEAQLFRRRALVAGAGAMLLVLVLFARLLYLQYVAHDHYTTLSNDNRVRIEAIAPTRGLIFDRDGAILAENLPSFTLELVPERVDDLDATLERLRPLLDFDEQDVERLREAWRRARPFEGVPLRFRLTSAEVARLSVHRHRFPGVDIVAGLTRNYPYAGTGVHALGYVGRLDERDLERLDESAYRATSHVGKLGIEYAYEDVLHGEPGVRRVEVNVQGRVLRVLDEEQPVPGRNVYMTLDIELQRLAERLLADRDGAVVALDPRNGEILALASTPTFDPNQFVNGIGREAYAKLRDSKHRPLFNRAIKGQYPPGSTIKPVVALNGLEADARIRDKEIRCRGYWRLDGTGRRYRDWKTHGEVDLKGAIEESCDVMFYELAVELGINDMAAFMRRFGLGQRTGIDIPGERDGLVPDKGWKRAARGEPWYKGETPIHGIGQGYLNTTPVQLAALSAMLANRGEPVRPHLFLRRGAQNPAAAQAAAERAPDTRGDVAEGGAVPRGDTGGDGSAEASRASEGGDAAADDPGPGEPVVPPVELSLASDWEYVIDGMVDVTEGENGTARSIGWKSPHTIAGKTGTAQVFGLAQDEEYDEDKIPEELRDHGLFIAFAPVDQPRIAVAVVVENGGGSSAATPIAQQVIDAWLGPEPLPGDRQGDDADGDA